jgi:DNA repair protein SbcD/Mre11
VSLKMLHTADNHLGMTFTNRDYPDDVSRQLVEARFENLEKLVNLAEEEKCHLIIVAGDLFHRVSVSTTHITKAVKILKRFSGIIALLPGNHDYYETNGPLWAKLKEIATEEMILMTEQAPYNLSDYGIDAVLYPAPCDGKHSSIHRLDWITKLAERPAAKWHVGVAHGSVHGVSPDFNEQYYPMEEAELVTCGLNHWCLGHTHIPYPNIQETGSVPYIYSGTPEPDGFDCRHEGSVWVTELQDNGTCFNRLIKTGQYRFVDIEKAVNDINEILSIADSIESDSKKTLVKLKLAGTLPEEDYRDRLKIINQVAETLFYLEYDDNELSIEIDASIIDGKYPQGSFPHHLLGRLIKLNETDAVQIAYRLIEEVKK